MTVSLFDTIILALLEMILNDYKNLTTERATSRFATVSAEELEMKINYDSKLDRRRDPRGPGSFKRNAPTFEEWEKLPSDIKLTRGECNQLYNILTWDNSNPEFRVRKLIDKLEKQI